MTDFLFLVKISRVMYNDTIKRFVNTVKGYIVIHTYMIKLSLEYELIIKFFKKDLYFTK